MAFIISIENSTSIKSIQSSTMCAASRVYLFISDEGGQFFFSFVVPALIVSSSRFVSRRHCDYDVCGLWTQCGRLLVWVWEHLVWMVMVMKWIFFSAVDSIPHFPWEIPSVLDGRDRSRHPVWNRGNFPGNWTILRVELYTSWGNSQGRSKSREIPSTRGNFPR